MNNSDRDPDAIDRIRDDKLTEQKWKWPVAPDGMSATVNARLQEQAARIASLESELKTMTSAADLLEAQKDAIARERNEARGAEIQLAALRPKLADCEIALMKANAALAAANAKDGKKTREINLLTQENRQQAAQLAAATEREPQRMYLFLIGEACDCLTSLLSEDEDEIHPEATIVRDRLAAALAAAQEGATNE